MGAAGAAHGRGFSHAEIPQLELARFADEDILGLYIPMDDVFSLAESQGAANLTV